MPPFKRECPHEGCKEIFASTNFSSDEKAVKNREKKWVQEEARKGEEDSLGKLFGI